MTIPPNDSAFWPALRFIVVSTLLTLMLALNYNRFDGRDLVTIVTVLGGLAGFDAAKRVAVNKETEE